MWRGYAWARLAITAIRGAGYAELESSWPLVVAVWEGGLLGVDIGKILVAVAIFVALPILRRLFGWFVVNRLKRWAERSSTRLHNKVIAALEGPIRFVPVVMGAFFAVEWLVKAIKEHLARKIKDIVEGAGSGFAFPSQSLYVETLPTERPEAFVPPAA